MLSKQRALSTQCPSPSRHSVLSASIVCGMAPDAVAAHDTTDTAIAHAAKAAATAAPTRPKSAEEIVRLVLDKADAEEGAPQGG